MTNTLPKRYPGTIDIKIVFQRTQIYYYGPDGREIRWAYYYQTDLENIFFEERKQLMPGKYRSVAEKFARLLGIEEIIELYKNHRINLYINISMSRYPWNLLRTLYKNISVFPVVDVEKSKSRKPRLKKLNFLIIANMNYFATNENLLLFEEELQGIRDHLEPFANSIDLRILYTPDIKELESVLAAQQFHIVHYIGHSAYVPRYDRIFFQFLESGSSKTVRMDMETFGKLLEKQKCLQLLFINSCTSGYPTADFSHSLASFKILQTGACAVAMRYPVNDRIGRHIGDFYINYFQRELQEALKMLVDDLENTIQYYFSPVLYLPHKGSFAVGLPEGGRPPSPLTHRQTQQMVGRESELNVLSRLLKENSAVNIHGPAKIGKTMLIEYFLNRNRYRFSKKNHQEQSISVYSFKVKGAKKHIIESRRKIQQHQAPITSEDNMEYLHLGDLSEAEAAFLFSRAHNKNIIDREDADRFSGLSWRSLLRNPYLILQQSDGSNSRSCLELIETVYGSETGKNFSREELGMILLLVLAPFPLNLAEFDIISRIMLIPHGKNYRNILQEYIQRDWIALVDNRIRIYSHAFLALNENDFNGLDREILKRNAKALIHFIKNYKKEYRHTENEDLTAFLASKEYFLGRLIGDEIKISELVVWNTLEQVLTLTNKEIAESKLKKVLKHHASMNPGSEKNQFIYSSVLAKFYQTWNDKINAITHYKEAIKQFERLNFIKNKDGFIHYANYFYELSNLENTLKLQLHYLEKALEYYKKSGDQQEIKYAENRINYLKQTGGT
jgi:hypothetical protein